jgi:hypothetical protein
MRRTSGGLQISILGGRVAKLWEALLTDLPLRNKLKRWLHWRNSEVNALFIDLLTLLISIYVVIISIALAGV